MKYPFTAKSKCKFTDKFKHQKQNEVNKKNGTGLIIGDIVRKYGIFLNLCWEL